ncbi:hypothetical protein [Roseiterribacter gracilis]|uniref:Uncharacterized protein n=1 Tax=Roseiterribacter gracilis TaxID=2812848 RepID=A0A8S8XAG5_9PROT|nr:hypothetical protein TMPK1_03630 [Rhodospirillales bacterium TMPK1]
MKRRSFLLGSAALAAAPSAYAADDWRVEIETQGRTLSFAMGAARDMGAFVSPIGKFEQRCLRADATDAPFTVFFRPDRGDARMEVVVEYGRLWTPAANGAPYRTSIFRGGTQVAQIDVPRADWRTRWRWQSAPRRVVRDANGLVREHLIPAFASLGAMEPPPKPQLYRPTEAAGVTAYMPTTGDRPDIGPLTEAQAAWVGGDSGSLQTLLAQAEAAASVPWHFRDERTGAPIDLQAYPEASCHPNGGNPKIAMADKTLFTPDKAHQPALSYLPYAITGDPYFLEELQFQATFDDLADPPGYKQKVGQVRSSAWSLRTLAQVTTMTPDNVPSWLRPKASWSSMLLQLRDSFRTRFVDGKEIPQTVFHTTQTAFDDRGGGAVPPGVSIAPWQEDFQCLSLGWITMLGFEGFLPIFRWKVAQTIARTDGRSGWNRAVATPGTIMLRANKDSPWCANWAEAWALNRRVQNFPEPSDDWVGLLTPLTFTRAALAMATQLGVDEARSSFRWADDQLRSKLASQRKKMPWRFALAGR